MVTPSPPPPPDRSSLGDLGKATEQVGRSITKLVLWGALFLIALVVLIGVIAGDSDDNAATPPQTTEATEAPDNGVATTEAPDPVVTTEAPNDGNLAIAAVTRQWGRCIAAGLAFLDLDEPRWEPLRDIDSDRIVATKLLEESERLGAEVYSVLYGTELVRFQVQLTRGSLPETATLPFIRPTTELTDALLELGMTNDPDCF